MSPNQVIINGIIKRVICNYFPHYNRYHSDNNILFYGNLRQIKLSNDVIFIKQHSILFRKIFEYQQLMINTVHSPYQISVKKHQNNSLITIPIAAFPNGIFISNDDARRFYQWLKLTLN